MTPGATPGPSCSVIVCAYTELRWEQISAGYAWQEAEIRETTMAAPAGRKVPLVPKHSFALWSRYDVTKSLGFGAGLTARSKSFASISNQVVLPGYARVDAAMFYKVGPARPLDYHLRLASPRAA